MKNAQPAITASPRHVSHELRIHITVPAWFLTVIVVRRRTSGIPLMEVLGWWLTPERRSARLPLPPHHVLRADQLDRALPGVLIELPARLSRGDPAEAICPRYDGEVRSVESSG